MRIMTLALLVFLMGCSVNRDVLYSMRCKNCKTVYGNGELIEFKIKKVLTVKR